ncbi:MAG TPA: indolepyruvate ferredoxin oxidoreductase family protein [Beijerinckiaceae bacterium]|nr:indolepyruvate ferredoxin oxidoreductase family protein [Beijerinckiaceae bacterium]
MELPLALRQVSLADKYDLSKNEVFLSGTQAIVRMLLMQRERDRRAGLNTAGFVSGYRGSPLGGLDQQLIRARREIAAAPIRFEPGLNEDLAATACWGTQQAEMRGEGRYDGVFALWYGKGPGVDRTGDVFRHANMAGTSRHGGVIALAGDDHTAESSTNAHQTEFNFVDTMIPILNPAGVQEILDYGQHAYAMSRFAGVWVALKAVKDNVESTASVDGSLERVSILTPGNYPMPDGGLNIRPRDNFLEQERRLHEFKREAALAYVRANGLNQMVFSGGAKPRIGIITVGKSYLDTRAALASLGIDAGRAQTLGIRLFKIACPWPIDPEELKDFARGLDTIMVVEEKRSLIEVQVREELYGSANQPVVVGKRDEGGQWLFPVTAALDPNDIAIAIGERLIARQPNEEIRARIAGLRQAQTGLARIAEVAARVPYFCSGCPHNSSTVVPEGARAYAGIGCHYMVQWMDRETEGFTQMGGEGANWIGESTFSTRNHVFQNLGDGTYNHSGSLAIRWAIAAKTNITYKILFNDAVAMTGGQTHEGALTPWRIAQQVRAEGVERIALVSDDPYKYGAEAKWPPGVSFHHRSELMPVQKELAAIPGVTVMIYDQTCAAEKRRRRKRGLYPDPDKRVIINELVCEGCGDCGKKSNCVSVQPLETEYGRKRRIDQSNCNKDFSCLEGFCPSFVTIEGARLKKAASIAGMAAIPSVPEPEFRDLDHDPWSCIVTGVGGTGVVTVGAILGMAAHLEGRGCGMIDMAGLAQKGGAVFSHIRLARSPEDIHAIRVEAGSADLILGCDLVVSGSRKVLAAMRQGETVAVVNTAEVASGEFTRKPDYQLPAERLKRSIREAAGEGRADFVDATAMAARLFGNTLAANMFMLGYAFQRGAVPLVSAAIEQAIRLNQESVEMNLAAFRWGRVALHDMASIRRLIDETIPPTRQETFSQGLDGLIERRMEFLTNYQNAGYALAYRRRVEVIRAAEEARMPGSTRLTEAVARSYAKLLSYKDEYEVARLYTSGSFLKQVNAIFEGDMRFTFHMAPPLLNRRHPSTGEPMKSSFGPWMMRALKVLARLKGLRGTAFDPFGRTAERRTERQLIADYEVLLDEFSRSLGPGNHAVAVELASLPEQIRGFGHVKDRHIEAARREHERLMQRYRAGGDGPPLRAAAE